MKPLSKKNIFIILFVLLTVCLLASKLSYSANKGFLISPYIISSSSMEPEFPVYSVVIIKREKFSELEEGDVIAFKSKALNNNVAMHRIIKEEENGFLTKGDANPKADNQLIKEDDYIGKCVFKITFFAHYISAIKKPLGFIIFFIMPLFAIIMTVVLIKLLKTKRKQNE